MLRAALAALLLAAATCGVKGPPQPPLPEARDAGAPDAGSDDGGLP
jgi:predicted small lipoprotein YifL